MGIGNTVMIQLIRQVVEQNGEGRMLESQDEVINIWAEISNPSGFRSYDHNQSSLETSKTFKVRFRFDKLPNVDWKIKYESRYWTIDRIQKVDEKRFYWQITATKKGNT